MMIDSCKESGSRQVGRKESKHTPEVGLLCLLLKVEADQLAAQEHRSGSTPNGIDEQRRKERRVDRVQDA